MKHIIQGRSCPSKVCMRHSRSLGKKFVIMYYKEETTGVDVSHWGERRITLWPHQVRAEYDGQILWGHQIDLLMGRHLKVPPVYLLQKELQKLSYKIIFWTHQIIWNNHMPDNNSIQIYKLGIFLKIFIKWSSTNIFSIFYIFRKILIFF